jgi:threonine aldolase
MRSFGSDNNSGVHPEVMEALVAANAGHAAGYGEDIWTQGFEAKIRETFGEDAEGLIVFNGTGANSVALQLLTRPYNSILCAATAHIWVDECGAPCRMTGCQVTPIATPDGKLTPELLRPHIWGMGDQHHSQPGALYISNLTEVGTLYTPDELCALTAFAHAEGMMVCLDGARLANAAAALNLPLRALTTDCGIDVLSFGGTKNGLMLGESVVVLNPKLRREARFVRKQSAQLASKMRYISCQMDAYLTNDLWRRNAEHANRMAQQLHYGLADFPQIETLYPVEGNMLFLRMPQAWGRALRQDYYFYFMNEEESELRLVTSFDTTEEDIAGLLQKIRAISE